MKPFYSNLSVLTNKELEIEECLLSIVVTDALVLKHQAISIHSAAKISIALDQFLKNITFIVNITTKCFGCCIWLHSKLSNIWFHHHESRFVYKIFLV